MYILTAENDVKIQASTQTETKYLKGSPNFRHLLPCTETGKKKKRKKTLPIPMHNPTPMRQASKRTDELC